MSSADPAEVSMVVSRDGVMVDKSFEPDDFPVPAIAFVIRSERDELVSVRLVDDVPDSVDPQDIGFHPKYGAEHWSVEDGKIAFEREFEAGEEYTTVYGLRASQTEDIESYMTEPDLDSVDPPAANSGQAVRNVIGEEPSESNNGSSPSSSDIEAALSSAEEEADGSFEEVSDSDADDEETIEPFRLEDPKGDVEPEIPNAESTAGTSSAGDTPADDDLVAALASQLRAGEASTEDVDVLQRALAASGGDGSTDARIVQLQSEVADLRSYTNALEAFLDENGDARQLVEDVKGGVERLESELSDLRSQATRTETDIAAVSDDLDAVSSEVESAAGRIDELESGVSEFRDHVDESLSTVRDDIDTVESDADEIRERVDDVTESLEAVDDLEDRLESLEDEFAASRDDLQALSEMREQLSSVFGAQVDSPDGDADGEE